MWIRIVLGVDELILHWYSGITEETGFIRITDIDGKFAHAIQTMGSC